MSPACDGVCVPWFHTALLDRWLRPSGRQGEQLGEGQKEGGPTMEDENRRVGTTMGAANGDEAEVTDGRPKVKCDAPNQDTGVPREVFDIEAMAEEPVFEGDASLSPLQCLQTLLNLKSAQGTQPQDVYPVSSTEEASPEAECWDDYTFSGASDAELDLAQLLKISPEEHRRGVHSRPHAGWHFPVGRGLTEVVRCPLWDFPTMSYYTPMQQTPFEVVWRVWEEVSATHAAGDPAPGRGSLTDREASFDFTVMSYNILAQDLLEANLQLYSHCPLEVLKWSHRCRLLLEEIVKWVPDIVCLQEVQENHYTEQLLPVLSQCGYKCVYKRRTGTKTDGCATCYRGDRFSELSVSLLEFLRPETGLLDRDNVGVVVLLQPVAGSAVAAQGPPICVANTHLLFNPRRGDVKLAQLAIALAEVSDVVRSCRGRGQRCEVVLCGDFNSLPESPLYSFITTGRLFYQGLPVWMVSGQENLSFRFNHHRLFAPLWPSSLGITDNCHYAAGRARSESQSKEAGNVKYSHDFLLQLRFCPAACVRPLDLELIPGVTDNTPDISRTYELHVQRNTIHHGLNLCSVYQHTRPGSGLPEVTTLHSEVGATVDYIFYSPKCDWPSDDLRGDGHLASGGLKLLGYLSLLSEDDLWAMGGLPNPHFPSDHLSLLAKFQIDLSPA